MIFLIAQRKKYKKNGFSIHSVYLKGIADHQFTNLANYVGKTEASVVISD